MTVTVTALGPNTTQINLANETSLSGFITALDNAIVSAGWAQYDVSNQYNRIYSCLNADGVTQKLIGITIDPGNFKISTTSYESWNNTTHVGTNETFTFNRAGTSGIALNLCDVLVMASSKWLVIQTFIRNQPGPWSGVFEVAREAPEDTATAGYPCWCWTSSAIIFSTVNSTSTCVVFPRTVGGLTGQAAASAGVGLQLPLLKINGSSGSVPSTLANTNLRNYAWNTNNRLIQDARPVVGYNELHGRIYGMKLTYNVGQPFNQVSIPTDQYFNYSATGTNATHWVLGGNPTTAVGNALNTAGTLTNITTRQYTTLTGALSVVPVGANWYVSTTAGVAVIDDSATTMSVSANIASGTGTGGIVYDGYQFVYVATSTGITKIDTLNGNNTYTLAITGGINAMYYDGTYLWAGSATSGASAKLSQINLSSFTVASTITIPNTASSIYSICSDNVGNTYVLTNETAIYKVVNSSGTATKIYSTSSGTWPPSFSYNGDNLTLHVPTFSGYVSGYYYTYSAMFYLTTTGSVISSPGNPTIWSTTSGSGCFNNQTSYSAPIAKFGIYDLICLANSGSGIGMGFAYANGTYAGAVSSNVSVSTVGLGCDSNRIWGLTASTLTVFNGINNADELNTAFGRILLPK